MPLLYDKPSRYFAIISVIQDNPRIGYFIMVLYPVVVAQYYNQPTIISIQDSRVQAIPLYS